jgi:hypothetical protein
VPTAVKLQEQFGDDLQVIFVECQGANRDQYEAFAWKMKWMGGPAMWTEERPFGKVANTLPETALIGVDGKILLQGNPGNLGSKLEEAIVAEIKKSKKAPEGTPSALTKAWTAFAKGDIADALAECDKVGTDEATAAREEFTTRWKRSLARGKWLVDNGYAVEAEEHLAQLAKGAKGAADLEAEVAAEVARLAEPSRADEREASKAYDTFVGQVARKKPFDASNVRKAEGLAKKFAGTKSGERLERFVTLADVK